jgi:hypothetical protein
MSHNVAGALRIGMLAKVGFEIVLEDSSQIASDISRASGVSIP